MSVTFKGEDDKGRVKSEARRLGRGVELSDNAELSQFGREVAPKESLEKRCRVGRRRFENVGRQAVSSMSTRRLTATKGPW